MLGLSRWTEKGGSDRTIQRLDHTILPWNAIQWLFFRNRFLRQDNEYLIAGDEGVVSKAGRPKGQIPSPNFISLLESTLSDPWNTIKTPYMANYQNHFKIGEGIVIRSILLFEWIFLKQLAAEPGGQRGLLFGVHRGGAGFKAAYVQF